MIWVIRAILGCLVCAPFIGVLMPGLDVAQATDGALGSGEIELVGDAVTLAAVATAVQLLVCMAALTIILVDRNALRSLVSLVIALSIIFLIPAPLRARAFVRLWEELGVGPSYALFLLWSLSFNTVFFWAAAVAYTQSDRYRSSLFAARELAEGWRGMLIAARMFAPALAAAAVASFVVSLMSGREVNILTTNQYPLGSSLRGLIGGRDGAAALLCAALMSFLLILMFFTWKVGLRGPGVTLARRRRANTP